MHHFWVVYHERMLLHPGWMIHHRHSSSGTLSVSRTLQSSTPGYSRGYILLMFHAWVGSSSGG